MRRMLCLCLLLFFMSASSAYARDANDGNSIWNGGLVQIALGDQPEFPFVDLEKGDGGSWGNGAKDNSISMVGPPILERWAAPPAAAGEKRGSLGQPIQSPRSVPARSRWIGWVARRLV